MEEQDVQDVRAMNLSNWVNFRFQGSQAAFADTYGISRPEVSELISGKRGFADRKARKLETLTHMPENYLDADPRNKYTRSPNFIPVIELQQLGCISAALDRLDNLLIEEDPQAELLGDPEFTDPLTTFLPANIAMVPCLSICSNRAFALQLDHQSSLKLQNKLLTGGEGNGCIVICDTYYMENHLSPQIILTLKDGLAEICISPDTQTNINLKVNCKPTYDSISTRPLNTRPVKAIIIGIHHDF